MADIDIEQRRSKSWIWWLLGLIILALLIWWIAEMMDDDDEVAAVPAATAPVVDPAVPVAAAPAGLTIAQVLANPAAYAGQSFSTGPVRVAEVVSDRGFWVENEGQRLFVVKNESPQSGVADAQGAADTRAGREVNAGDTVQINGTLYTSLDQIQPPLDAQTRQAVQDQPVVLQANVADIQ